MKSTRLFIGSLFVSVALVNGQQPFSKTPIGPSTLVRQKMRDHVFVAVRGGTFHLLAMPRRPLLLAFLQVLPGTASTSSRSEAVYLESMEHQYGARGLRVAVIDSSSELRFSTARHIELLNASYDWHLTFPLLEDANGSVARDFRIRTLPTVVLVDDAGFIVQSWEGYAPPALMAQGIERLLGGPLGTIPGLTTH